MSGERRVVITGVGTVNALAPTAAQMLSSLSDGTPHRIQRPLPIMPGHEQLYWMATLADDPAPRLSERAEGVLAELGYAEHRDLIYTVVAIQEALASAGYEYDAADNTLGAVLSFEAPGMERTVATLFDGLTAGTALTDLAGWVGSLGEAFYRTQAFVLTHVIGKCFRLHGFTTCVSNACSSGIHALDLAAGVIRDGRADAMLIAGGEHFETGVRLAYFDRQQFYASSGEVRPFTNPATGFIVGEGGAALLLESLEHALARSAPILCEVFPAAFAQQSWHQTLPNVRDRRLEGVMRRALAAADASTNEIDFIVGHGAATRVSDEYELDCIRAAMAPRDLPPVLGFKGLFGHLLGASALVDLAVLALAHREGGITANPVATRASGDLPCRTTLKIATGFTGHDAALVMRSLPDHE